MNALVSSARSVLLSAPEVSRVASLRRAAPLFSQGQAADTAYFIEDGLVKLTRTSAAGGRIIVSICGPGHLVGEEVLSEDGRTYHTEAEVLSPATLYRIPREPLKRLIASNPELALAVISHLLEHKLELAEKVEMLCLHDVEYRILHYLAELSKLVKPLENWRRLSASYHAARIGGPDRRHTRDDIHYPESARTSWFAEAFAAFAHHFVSSYPPQRGQRQAGRDDKGNAGAA